MVLLLAVEEELLIFKFVVQHRLPKTTLSIINQQSTVSFTLLCKNVTDKVLKWRWVHGFWMANLLDPVMNYTYGKPSSSIAPYPCHHKDSTTR